MVDGNRWSWEVGWGMRGHECEVGNGDEFGFGLWIVMGLVDGDGVLVVMGLVLAGAWLWMIRGRKGGFRWIIGGKAWVDGVGVGWMVVGLVWWLCGWGSVWWMIGLVLVGGYG
ncbi:hypothetical protein RJT34_13135 [Clitoria ternatea]|uniref:Transmembrane protein n=1 Tax=Clitoria ternatea TaxID=43366 RepID=A0AAN9JMZ8_CLITE